MPSLSSLARGSIVIIVAFVLWWAILWRLIAPDFSTWKLPSLAALHFAPPLAGWALWRLWRQLMNLRQSAATASREELAEKERHAKREAARAKYAAEVEGLRYGCDCRLLASADILLPTDAPEPPVHGGEAIEFSRANAQSEDSVERTLLDHLRPGIEQALSGIYSRLPVAAAFPLYVAPPADLPGEALATCLRSVKTALLSALGLQNEAPACDRILFLPARESFADIVIGIFETNPDLPAAVVLALDSPWWRNGQADRENALADQQQARGNGWAGPPSQGVFALFMTHPQLPQMLATAPIGHGAYDALTPFWEKEASVASPAYLSALSAEKRSQLARFKPLARIHRAAGSRFEGEPRGRSFARSIETLIERAQVNAALIDLPFDEAAADGASPAANAAASPPPKSATCGWLIHNAGPVDCSGNRLAALGLALTNRGIELDPIAEASNIVVKAGDFGQARGAAMLAMTVTQAAHFERAALCAEFAGEGLSVFFATTPESAA